MRTRLGFAVAVYMHPQILILDEVLAVGDELFKRKCFAKMEELFERGCTVLFVSHSVNSVNQICERALFFDNGRLIMEGPTKLVTLGYQRFLFSNDHEKPAVLKELMAVNLDRESQCGGQIEETQPQAEDFGAWEDVDNINDDFFDLLKSFSEKPTACFLPEFVSKSETVTRNHDIDIEDLRIVSANGKRVNVLVSNEKYMVAFRVRFNQPASRVFFHVSFKTEKGFKLGSDVVPNVPQRIDNISPGGVFEVEWRFTCTFLKGNFYISIGVHSSDSENDSILYRIDDGYVFKVVNPVNFSYRGFVHFNQRGAIYRIGPMDEREAILLKNEISEQ